MVDLVDRHRVQLDALLIVVQVHTVIVVALVAPRTHALVHVPAVVHTDHMELAHILAGVHFAHPHQEVVLIVAEVGVVVEAVEEGLLVLLTSQSLLT